MVWVLGKGLIKRYVDEVEKENKMGLDINRYSYGYSTLHELRARALECEKSKYHLDSLNEESVLYFYSICGDISGISDKTKYPEFINHSDCESGYIIDATMRQRKEGWGDLDLLKKEVIELNDFMVKTLDERYLGAWKCFIDDVENAYDILIFS